MADAISNARCVQINESADKEYTDCDEIMRPDHYDTTNKHPHNRCLACLTDSASRLRDSNWRPRISCAIPNPGSPVRIPIGFNTTAGIELRRKSPAKLANATVIPVCTANERAKRDRRPEPHAEKKAVTARGLTTRPMQGHMPVFASLLPAVGPC